MGAGLELTPHTHVYIILCMIFCYYYSDLYYAYKADLSCYICPNLNMHETGQA